MPTETTYVFEVNHAALTRNLRTVTEMSPYVQLNMGGVIRKTKIVQDAGMMPKWNQKLKITSYGGSLLRIQVYDQGIYNQQLIGEGIINLKSYGLTCNLQENIEYTKPHRVIVELKYGGQLAGQLYLSIKRVQQQFSPTKYLTELQDQNRIGDNSKQKDSMKEDNVKIFGNIALQNILKMRNSVDLKTDRIQHNNMSLVFENNFRSKQRSQSPIQYSPRTGVNQKSMKTDRYGREAVKLGEFAKDKKTNYIFNTPLSQYGLPSPVVQLSRNLKLRY